MPERSQWSWTGLNTGFWAAVLAAAWTVWFIVAFGIWMRRVPEWQGVESYAASFDAVGYMAWLIPCFLLAITFPVLIAAIYLYLPADRRAPALVALMFATLYGSVLGATYFVSGTVVPAALQSGSVNGLEWLVIGSPNSILSSLEGAGYLFMGLSMLFAGLAWRVPGKWRRVTRWLFFVNGISGIAGVMIGIVGYMEATMIMLGAWALTFPAVAILLAWRFKQDLRVAPTPSRVMRT